MLKSRYAVCLRWFTIVIFIKDVANECNFSLNSNDGEIKANIPQDWNCSVSIRSNTGTKVRMTLEISDFGQGDCSLQLLNDSEVEDFTESLTKEISSLDNELDLKFTCRNNSPVQFSIVWEASNHLQPAARLPIIKTNDVEETSTGTAVDITTTLKDIGQVQAITNYFQWLLGQMTKEQLVLMGLGFVFITVFLSCLFLCVRRRKRPEELVMDNLDVKDDAEKSKDSEAEQNKEDETINHSENMNGSTRTLSEGKERVYHEINETLLKPIDPESMVELTADGYIKMSRPKDVQVDPSVQSHSNINSREPSGSNPDKRSKYFQRLSSMIHRRRGEHDIDPEATKQTERNVNPLRHLKSMEEYCRKKKQQFAKFSKGKWLQDQNVWHDI